MHEPIAEPVFPDDASTVIKPRRSPWVDLGLIGAVLVSGLLGWYWYQGRQKRVEAARQEQIDQAGKQILAEARDYARQHDPAWRFADFPQRVPDVSPQQDGAALLRLAYEQWQVERPGPYVPWVPLVYHVKPNAAFFAAPSSRIAMHPDARQYLTTGAASLQACVKRVGQAVALKGGNFPVLTQAAVTSYLDLQGGGFVRLRSSLRFGLFYDDFYPYRTINGALCEAALAAWCTRQGNAWDALALSLRFSSLPRRLCPDNLEFQSHACQETLGVVEWILGQGVEAETSLHAFELQLQAQLRQSQPLHDTFITYRALADLFPDRYQARTADVTDCFGTYYEAMRENVYGSAAECIRFVTDALPHLEKPLPEFHAWFAQRVATYPGGRDFLSDQIPTMNPRRYFRTTFLASLEDCLEEYLKHQERLRITLVAVACERYRLRHQQFPSQAEQLHEVMDLAAWNDLFAKESPIHLHLYKTSFGLVVTSLAGNDLPSEGGVWENFVAMIHTGAYTRIGFRLFHPELRGKAPAEPGL
jgi:hypothetical protein